MKTYSPQMLVMFSIVNILLAILSSCGNALVFFTVVSFSELHISSNIGLASLAAANFFEGLFVHCLCAIGSLVVLEGGCPFSRLRREIIRFLSIVFTYSAVLNLTLVTLERYVGIIHSLRYQVILSRQRVVNFIIAVWFTSLFISVPSLFDNKAVNSVSHTVMTTTLFVALAATFYFNFSIHRASRRQRREVQAQQQAVLRLTNENQQQYRFRGAKTMFLIFITLVICFIPALTARVIQPYSVETRVFRAWAGTSFGLYSSVSPFVYFFRCSELRRYTMKLFRYGLRVLKGDSYC